MTAVTSLADEGSKSDLRAHAGAWLRAERERRGLSQRELAEKVGVLYYTFISQIEAGRGRMPAERYAAWADALSIDRREFAINMLKFYEPATHDLIFGSSDVASSIKDAKNDLQFNGKTGS